MSALLEYATLAIAAGGLGLAAIGAVRDRRETKQNDADRAAAIEARRLKDLAVAEERGRREAQKEAANAEQIRELREELIDLKRGRHEPPESV